MTSKVNSKLHLRDHGKSVDVVGPISSWDDDEISATFSVVITQVNEAGNVVTANGSSTDGYANPDSTSWDAVATVTDPALSLENGPATAYATATILVDGPSYETYTWTLVTRLIG
jgi:hypothetical protein